MSEGPSAVQSHLRRSLLFFQPCFMPHLAPLVLQLTGPHPLRIIRAGQVYSRCLFTHLSWIRPQLVRVVSIVCFWDATFARPSNLRACINRFWFHLSLWPTHTHTQEHFKEVPIGRCLICPQLPSVSVPAANLSRPSYWAPVGPFHVLSIERWLIYGVIYVSLWLFHTFGFFPPCWYLYYEVTWLFVFQSWKKKEKKKEEELAWSLFSGKVRT